jgi:hypothetical protein
MQNDEKTTAERLRLQGTTLAEFGLHAFRTDDLEELLHRAAELVADGLRVRRAKVLELMRGGQGAPHLRRCELGSRRWATSGLVRTGTRPRATPSSMVSR